MKDYTKINQVQKPGNIITEGKPEANSPVPRLLIMIFSVLVFMVISVVVTEILDVASQIKEPAYTPAKIPPMPARQPQPTEAELYKNPFPEVTQELNIQTAYALTNVKRVAYSKERSRLPANIADYLQELFTVTDFLVIERVQNHRLLAAGKPIDLKAYDIALANLKSMTVPQQLGTAHANIISAIENQRTYFSLMQQTGQKFMADHMLVKTSSSQLIKAWKIMGKQVNQEEKRNLYSLEKHLCALDFI